MKSEERIFQTKVSEDLREVDQLKRLRRLSKNKQARFGVRNKGGRHDRRFSCVKCRKIATMICGVSLYVGIIYVLDYIMLDDTILAIPIVPIVMLLASVLGTYLTNRANNKAVDETNAMNMQINQMNNQANLDLYNKQNAYNSPINQMMRLSEAGLNPNLVYGHGSIANTASDSPRMAVPNLQSYTGNSFKLGDAAESFLLAKQSEATTENLRQQNSVIAQQAITETMKQASLAADTARTKFDLGMAEKLQENSIQVANANLNRIVQDTELVKKNVSFDDLRRELTRSQINNLNLAALKLQQDYDYQAFEQNLKRIGVYPNDNLFFRILARLYDSYNKSLSGTQTKKGNYLSLPLN